MAKQLKPDVVIVDIGMPLLNGLDTTRQLLQHDPQFKIIVLTITDADQVIREPSTPARADSCSNPTQLAIWSLRSKPCRASECSLRRE